MTDVTGRVPGKPTRSRRQNRRAVIMAICGGLTLASLVTCCAVAVTAVTMFNRLGSAWDVVFRGLFEGIATFYMAIVFFLIAVFALLMELLSLLSTGQIILFFMSLAQLLR